MSIPKSFNNWLEDNYLELLDIAFDENSELKFVAAERYQSYLESIRDLES